VVQYGDVAWIRLEDKSVAEARILVLESLFS
jgi:hypothetical protein